MRIGTRLLSYNQLVRLTKIQTGTTKEPMVDAVRTIVRLAEDMYPRLSFLELLDRLGIAAEALNNEETDSA